MALLVHAGSVHGHASGAALRETRRLVAQAWGKPHHRSAPPSPASLHPSLLSLKAYPVPAGHSRSLQGCSTCWLAHRAMLLAHASQPSFHPRTHPKQIVSSPSGRRQCWGCPRISRSRQRRKWRCRCGTLRSSKAPSSPTTSSSRSSSSSTSHS
eukprot:2376560-Rhodomonas_salina.3